MTSMYGVFEWKAHAQYLLADVVGSRGFKPKHGAQAFADKTSQVGIYPRYLRTGVVHMHVATLRFASLALAFMAVVLSLSLMPGAAACYAAC